MGAPLNWLSSVVATAIVGVSFAPVTLGGTGTILGPVFRSVTAAMVAIPADGAVPRACVVVAVLTTRESGVAVAGITVTVVR
jgi:hypothetical protein